MGLQRDEYKSLVKLGLPVVVTQLGIIVVNFADTIMVGQYGTAELAAAAFVNNLFLVPFVMLIGFASGITPIIGALYTRNNNAETGHTLRVSLRLNILMGIFFTAVMGLIYFFLDRMGQPPELLPLIRGYYLIILCCMVVAAVFNCFQQAANGVTDTSMPMWIILSANLLNIIGNWLLIRGHLGFPELGLAGAGISTVTARALAAVAIIAVMLRSRRYRRYRAGFFSRERVPGTAKKVFFTSVPLMLQGGIECALWAFGAVVSGWADAIQLAAFQITNTISQLGFMTYLSFGIAVSIRVANYCGTRDLAGVRRITTAGLHFNLLLAVAASAIFIFGGTHILRIFTEDTAVILSAHGLLLPLVLYQLFDAVQLVYGNGIRGTSRVNPLLWASIIAYLAIGIPAVYLLGWTAALGNTGVYYGFCIAIFAVCVCLYCWYRNTLSRLQAGKWAE